MRFDIWREGYCATGGSGRAELMGTGTGVTFKDACCEFFSRPKNKDQQRYYNSKSNTYWGCRLYDNHRDAARAFG